MAELKTKPTKDSVNAHEPILAYFVLLRGRMFYAALDSVADTSGRSRSNHS